jgi:hypothetical protein
MSCEGKFFYYLITWFIALEEITITSKIQTRKRDLEDSHRRSDGIRRV